MLERIDFCYFCKIVFYTFYEFDVHIVPMYYGSILSSIGFDLSFETVFERYRERQKIT